MKQNDLLQILKILAKYIDEENDELSCDSYSIYMSPDHKDLDEEDLEKLERLGATWDTDNDCWQVFF